MQFYRAASIAALSLAIGGQAFAQQPAGQTIPTPTGPVIPGLCVISLGGLLAESQLGMHIDQRLNNIAQQTNAELTEAGRALEADRANLRARVEAQGEAALASEVEAFNGRVQAFLQLRDLRAAEIERTKQLAEQRFGDEARPLLLEVSQTRRCSIVLEMESMILPDLRADITPDVITAINAKITTFPIEKAVIQTPPPQPAQ